MILADDLLNANEQTRRQFSASLALLAAVPALPSLAQLVREMACQDDAPGKLDRENEPP